MSPPPGHRLPTSPSSRFVPWALALALLLKAALPMLAAASAGAQRKAVFEVCTVYGVRTADAANAAQAAPAAAAEVAGAVGQKPASPPADAGALHGGDHCALGALPLLAGTPEARAPPPAAVAVVPIHDAGTAAASRPDAAARWAARLQHGPPAAA